ncbi:MAG: hypothetical protein ABIH03_05130 [Pseudomonadota bacterium]
MASELDTAFSAKILEPASIHLGETAVYTPAGSTATTATIVCDRSTRRRIFDMSGAVLREEIDFTLLASDVETPIDVTAASGNGVDAVVIDTKTWYVVEVVERNVSGWHRITAADKVFLPGQ